jgi:hypothetical protein
MPVASVKSRTVICFSTGAACSGGADAVRSSFFEQEQNNKSVIASATLTPIGIFFINKSSLNNKKKL